MIRLTAEWLKPGQCVKSGVNYATTTPIGTVAAYLLSDRPYPVLTSCSESIQTAFELMRDSFHQGGKLLICGNGGSAADCDHIAGKLMKGFLLKRPLSARPKAPSGILFGAKIFIIQTSSQNSVRLAVRRRISRSSTGRLRR